MTGWYSVYYAQGSEHRESTGETELKAARKYHEARLHKVAADKRGTERYVPPVSQRVTVGALLDTLVKDYTTRECRAMKSFRSHVATLRAHFGTMRAASVDADAVTTFVNAQRKAGKKPATINRYTQVLRQAFGLAVRDGKVVTVPNLKRTRLPEDNARQGWLTREDFERLVTNLPEHLKDVARFGYLTGWRRNEILSLSWSDVDLDGGVITLRAANAKTSKPRKIVLDTTLRALVARREHARLSERGVTDLVFHKNGRPIGDFRFAWRTASVKAGLYHIEKDTTGKKQIIPDNLFHDLRRTAVRNMIRSGVPQSVAMKISGHKTVSMFNRYDIVSEDDLLAAAEAVGKRYELVTP